ncbi:MAG: hypothetical protein IJ319_03030 [Bacteroidaceae bacterium]|nr:hypothetical protein [Bacteroidaceae bacterium]
MKKILLSMLLVAFTGAAIAQNELVFKFTQSTGAVSVTDETGATVEGVSATVTLNIGSYKGLNVGNDTILCSNTNSSDASASAPITYTLKIEGASDFSFDNIFVRGVALNGGGNFQNAVQTPRQRYFAISTGKNEADITSYNEAEIKDICGNSYLNGNPTNNWFSNSESTAIDGTLYIKISVYNDASTINAEQAKGCFYGLTAVTLTQNHTLAVGEAGWASIILDHNTVIPETVEAYAISERDGSVATLAPVTGVLPANNAVLIKADTDNYTFAYTRTSATIASNLLSGALVDTEITPAEDTYYILANGANGIGLYIVDENPETEGYEAFTIGANKAYLCIEGGAASNVFSFRIEGTTAIDEVNGDNGNVEGIYDLTGRRVESISTSGIYIINGKKVVIK